MTGIYELTLARNLERKLAKALADAGPALVPAGTLGAGVQVTHFNDIMHSFDPIRGVLTVTGTVRIDVHGLTKAA
jgi:hypothetical protein